ncbi:MAG: twin-arginine translocation signal domain-containing protein, partial [Pirellulaceae bacterium]
MAGSDTRRDFLELAAAAALAGSLAQPSVAKERTPRKRIAILTTLWSYLHHGQHIGDRFLVGYPWEGDWHTPEVEVVSAYVAQKPTAADMQSREAEYGFPQGDLAPQRARQFGFGLYPTIAEALRCGGDSLVVDGVVI